MKIIATTSAPQAIGPYSQAIVAGGMVYCSGQIPLNPQSMQIEAEGIEAQTEVVLKNLAAVLKEANSSLKHVVRATVFLKNFSDFPKMNAIFERHFEGHKPSRSTVEVSRLPRDVLVEIDCIAVVQAP